MLEVPSADLLDHLMTAEEVAQAIGYAVESIHEAVRAGRFPIRPWLWPRGKGAPRLLFDRRELLELLRKKEDTEC